MSIDIHFLMTKHINPADANQKNKFTLFTSPFTPPSSLLFLNPSSYVAPYQYHQYSIMQ